MLLFKNGHPVLKVQQGTTLSVIKLLYQADPRNKGTVIALKPETDDPLPCLLTLDQSVLEEAKYEIITHGNTAIDTFAAFTKILCTLCVTYHSQI